MYCPCCNKRKLVFCHNQEMISDSKQNVVCPICASLPRHRVLCAIFDERDFDFTKTLLYNQHQCITDWLDVYEVDYQAAEELQSPPPPDTFTFIHYDYQLQTVPCTKAALTELYRITAKGGTVAVTAPIDVDAFVTIEDKTITTPHARAEAYGYPNCVRLFGRDLLEMLEAAGFEVEIFYGWKYPEEIAPWCKPYVHDSNRIYMCKK